MGRSISTLIERQISLSSHSCNFYGVIWWLPVLVPDAPIADTPPPPPPTPPPLLHPSLPAEIRESWTLDSNWECFLLLCRYQPCRCDLYPWACACPVNVASKTAQCLSSSSQPSFDLPSLVCSLTSLLTTHHRLANHLRRCLVLPLRRQQTSRRLEDSYSITP